MLTLLLLLVLGGQVRAPAPPYVRVDTVQLGDDHYNDVYTVAGHRLYAASKSQLVAVDLKTMKRLWSVTLSPEEVIRHIVVTRGLVLATTDDYGSQSHLFGVAPETGQVLWSIAGQGQASAMAVHDNRVYLILRAGALFAIDLKTRRTLWQTPLQTKGEPLFGAGSVSVSGPTVAVNYRSTTVCLARANGRLLWTENGSSGNLVATNGIYWVPSGEGSVARLDNSGRVLWRRKKSGPGDLAVAVNGKFLGMRYSQIACLEARTGKTLWSVAYPGMRIPDRANVTGGYLFAHSKMWDLSGRLVRSFSPETDISEPCWTDGATLVSFDGDRLLRFRHGVEPPVPADPTARKREAEGLAARYSELDAQGRERLARLGDEAFEPVLQLFLQSGKTFSSPDTVKLFSLLEKICRPGHCERLMDVVQALPPTNMPARELLKIIVRLGRPQEVLPFCLAELERNRDAKEPLAYEFVAVNYIMESADPRAIRFKLDQLADPNSNFGSSAYYSLAATGGAEGVQAVQAQRRQRKLLPPLPERVAAGWIRFGEFASATKTLVEQKDAQGRTWGLLQSGALGHAGDLWLAEKVGERWSNPLFCGVYQDDGLDPYARSAGPQEGKSGAQLLKSDWYGQLVGNATLRRDSDADGLTDLAEERLGTNPAKADTDGDGDPDGVDPWPNAPHRSDLTDEEQVLDAAFEACFHFSDREAPAVFAAPAGLKPFEMTGRSNVTMWELNRATPLGRCFSHGTGIISFQPENDQLVSFSKSRTEAKVSLSVGYGGLNAAGYEVTVRKFGTSWVVVSYRMAWVA